MRFQPLLKTCLQILQRTLQRHLMLTNCFVCGGTNQGERCPWESMEANILNPEIWKAAEGNRKAQQMLQRSIIVQTSWQNQNGIQLVSDLVCEGGYEWNETISNWTSWGSPQGMLGNLKNWPNNSQIPLGWPAPDGYYWICGKITYMYTKLPKNWAGPCVSGTFRPSFFLLPIT